MCYNVFKYEQCDALSMRKDMTRGEMALEMIRAKHSVPVTYLRTGDVYASMQEAADQLGVSRQFVSKETVKAKKGKNAVFEVAEDWDPYVELKACRDVDEYVLHYLRVYYPELYEDSLHVVRQESVRQRVNYHEIMGTLPIITIEDGHYYDVLTEEELGEVGE